jgi:hypothetical protein
VGGLLRLLGWAALATLLAPGAAQEGPVELWSYPTLDRVTGLTLPPNATYVAVHGGVLTHLGSNATVVRSLPVGIVPKFAAAPDGSFLATAVGTEITLRGSDFSPLWTYRATAVVNSMAVAARGFRTAIGTQDGTLVFVDREGRPVTGQRLEGPLEALGLSADGGTLAVSIPGTLLLLDGQAAEKWRRPIQTTSALAVAEDGSAVAIGSTQGRLRVFDGNGTERLTRTLEPPLSVTGLDLSANGSLLLVAWGDDVAALGSDWTTLWRRSFFRPVEALALSQDGSRAAVGVRGGLVHGLETGFVERPRISEPAVNASDRVLEPSPVPTPAADLPATPPPEPARPLPVGTLLAVAGAAWALTLLGFLHQRGLLLVPGLPQAWKVLRSVSARVSALKRRNGAPRDDLGVPKKGPLAEPEKPPAAKPWKPKPASPKPAPRTVVPRTPRVPPEVARLLRERAREEKTLENLDYMKGRGLLEESRYNALREEAMGRLKAVKQRLDETGYRD